MLFSEYFPAVCEKKFFQPTGRVNYLILAFLAVIQFTVSVLGPIPAGLFSKIAEMVTVFLYVVWGYGPTVDSYW